MQAIAAWLVARPLNSIAVLAATLLLPFRTMTSGATLVLLILHSGAQKVAIYALAAAGFVVGLGYITGLAVAELTATVAAIWLPIGLLAMLMRKTRSLTLTVQLSVVLAFAALLVINVGLEDPGVVGNNWLDQMIAYFNEVGNHGQANILADNRAELAPLVTLFIVLGVWLVYVMVLLFGYALFRSLPGQSAIYGRFCDLSLGRVLALTAAVVLSLTLVSNAVLLQQLAIMCIAVFSVQGLALMHWLQVERGLPMLVTIVVYLLLMPLAAILGPLLAMTGYADVWLDLRSRLAQRKPDKR
ncbi:MAG: hypothetical protein KJO31_06945 [Gammaproteobacteria bacterium]|nr:hypothetical protein [Gammaproteobacteria bacterium]